jgi:hypothetical protein
VRSVKRWERVKKEGFGVRGFSNSAQKAKPSPPPPQPSATPKQSNAAPVLGLLFGASAVAFIGTSLIPNKNVDIEHNEIHTEEHEEDVSDPKSMISTFLR